MTWVQGRLLLMGGLGYAFDAASVAIVAFILPPVSREFGLTNAETGVLGSSVLIGYLVGAFFAGTMGDIIGRKQVMMYALAVYCVGSLVAAASPTWEFLFWSRVVAGIGTGAESAIVAPFLSEFVQSRIRGRYVGSLSGFFSFGFVFAALLGYFIVPAHPEGWRIVQVITALPIVMLLWWRRALPESPRWLIQQGRSEEAKRIVDEMESAVERRVGPLPPLDSMPVPASSMTRAGSFLGNLAAIAQTNLKRMLAYSTIANMGYVLMGFLAADVTGYSAAMFYMVAYVMTSLVSFGMILLLSRKGFEADSLDDLKGLNARSPWWAFIMLLAMFSLAGMPPTIGFYAKLLVLQAVVKAGFVWLAVVGVIAALIGAFYYLRIVKLMYFDEPADRSPIDARGDTGVVLSANGLALLLFGILPQPIMGLCAVALVNSQYY